MLIQQHFVVPGVANVGHKRVYKRNSRADDEATHSFLFACVRIRRVSRRISRIFPLPA